MKLILLFVFISLVASQQNVINLETGTLAVSVFMQPNAVPFYEVWNQGSDEKYSFRLNEIIELDDRNGVFVPYAPSKIILTDLLWTHTTPSQELHSWNFSLVATPSAEKPQRFSLITLNHALPCTKFNKSCEAQQLQITVTVYDYKWVSEIQDPNSKLATYYWLYETTQTPSNKGTKQTGTKAGYKNAYLVTSTTAAILDGPTVETVPVELSIETDTVESGIRMAFPHFKNNRTLSHEFYLSITSTKNSGLVIGIIIVVIVILLIAVVVVLIFWRYKTIQKKEDHSRLLGVHSTAL